MKCHFVLEATRAYTERKKLYYSFTTDVSDMRSNDPLIIHLPQRRGVSVIF